VIYETGGELPDGIATDDAAGVQHYEKPGFQIRVRGGEYDYSDARTTMETVRALLHAKDLTNFVYVVSTGSVLPLGLDSNNRPEITQNFRTMRPTGV
jgi:hypothetical protein